MTDLFNRPFEDDEEPAPAEPIRRQIYSVSGLSAEIRRLLERSYVEIWVEGELSNCRRWTNGHLYFTLKDTDAQIKSVIFRSSLRYLKFTPEDGLHVLARGRISVYEPKGEYQLVCEHLEPKGHGALQLAFEQLTRRLQAEGLFDAARKRRLPSLPRKIGVVTSLDGAALRDIIKVVHRRYANVHLVIRPTRVQGDGAAAEIAHGIRQLGRADGIDVIIIARGGGSIEDLRAFNEEMVARAIVSSPVPVISGVGHETDSTIADFVADVRAATPSNAAELVLARKEDFGVRINRSIDRLMSTARTLLTRRRSGLQTLVLSPGLGGWRGRLALRGRHVVDLTRELSRAAERSLSLRRRSLVLLERRLDQVDQRKQLADVRARLIESHSRLDHVARIIRHRAELRLHTLAGRLDTLSPLAVLGRGYALCWAPDGTTLLRDAEAVRPGDHVTVTLERGEIGCEVTSVGGRLRTEEGPT